MSRFTVLKHVVRRCLSVGHYQGQMARQYGGRPLLLRDIRERDVFLCNGKQLIAVADARENRKRTGAVIIRTKRGVTVAARWNEYTTVFNR